MEFIKLAILVSIVAQSLHLSAYAQNREDSDKIFKEPAQSGGSQVMLGVAELLAGGALLYEAKPKSLAAVKTAEIDLKYARQLPWTPARYSEAIVRINMAINDYMDPAGVSKIDSATMDGMLRVLEVLKQKGTYFSRAEIDQAIANAEKELADSRQRLAQEIAATTKGQKIIKSIRRVGAALFIVDVGGRVYVWNILDADPTYSPTAKYIQHLIGK